MRYWIAACLTLSALPLGAQPVPLIAFDSVPNLLKLPQHVYLGEVSAVAVNSKGHIFVLSRGNTNGPAYAAAQLPEFAPDGTFLREIGRNLYAWSFAHAVRVDRDDNIGVTDKGSDMVVKSDPQGRVQMVFGCKQEASDEDTAPLKHPKPPLPAEHGRFRQVTDVTWDPAGKVYISDGDGNSRVAKADRNGNWITSWGERGDQPDHRRPAGPGREQGHVRARRAVDGLHHAAASAAVHLRRRSGPGLQAQPGRQGAGRAGHAGGIGQAAQAVRLDPPNRLPVGKRHLRRRIAELARAKAPFAAVEPESGRRPASRPLDPAIRCPVNPSPGRALTPPAAAAPFARRSSPSTRTCNSR